MSLVVNFGSSVLSRGDTSSIISTPRVRSLGGIVGRISKIGEYRCGNLVVKASDSEADSADPKPFFPVQSQTSKPVQGTESATSSLDVDSLIDELKDTKELGKRGESWFVLQAILMILVVFPLKGIQDITTTVGFCSFLAGLAVVASGGISLGDNLTPLPKPREGSHSLVTDGMFKYMRHPMYGGLIIASAGLGIATNSAARILLAGLLFLVLDKKATFEESFLAEKYGAEYSEYQSKVKKLLPWLY
jgi:protein-S-isoprenylcysteine O-methyltransferase Ste14